MKYIMTQQIAELDRPTKNTGRIYSTEVMDKAIEEYMKLSANLVSFPSKVYDFSVVDLSCVYGQVKNFEIKDNVLYATIEMDDRMPMAKELVALEDAKAKIDYNIVGIGDVNDKNEVKNFKIINIVPNVHEKTLEMVL